MRGALAAERVRASVRDVLRGGVCKCVPPGTYGHAELCGKCYTEWREDPWQPHQVPLISSIHPSSALAISVGIINSLVVVLHL